MQRHMRQHLPGTVLANASSACQAQQGQSSNIRFVTVDYVTDSCRAMIFKQCSTI